MNANKSIFADGTSKEVSALIETLHQTCKRLEELTAGEVDTVAGPDGHTFLLQRAQEQLRLTEAHKQAAILNALPAHVALLDSDGGIVTVNLAWRQFAAENGMPAPHEAAGANYLMICEHAGSPDAVWAAQAAAGVHSVLAGTVATFSFEYPCHSPSEQRWFLMTATRLADAGASGAVVMHVNISERKRAENETLRLANAMNATEDAIYLVDRTSMRFVHVNDAACRMQQHTREEVLALGPAGVLGLPRAEVERTYDAIIASGEAPEPLEMLRTRKDGSQMWIELRRQTQSSKDGWLVITMVRDITKRKKASNALQESDRRFSDMMANVDLISIMIDEQSRIVYCNDFFLRTTGWQRSELLGGNFIDLIIPSDLADEVRALHAAMFADLPAARHHENEIVTRTGERRLIRWNNTVLRSPMGTVTGVACLGEDITERKLREIALRESDEKFHQLADNIDDAFWIRSPDLSEVHYVSPAFEKIWGRSVDSLRASPRKWLDFIHVDDRERVMAGYAVFVANSVEQDIEYRIVRPDGEIRWVRVRGFRVRDDSGKVIRLAGIVTDITVRCATEQALQRQHAELRALFDLMPAMIWLKDTGDRILRINQRAATAAGKSIAEIEGKLAPEIYPQEAASFYADDLRVIQSGQASLGAVERFTGPDGADIWMQTDKVPYFDQAGQVVGIIAMAQDITERKVAAGKLRASLADFRDLAESMPQIVWTTRADGWCTYFNQQWTDYTGLSLAQSLGYEWQKSYHPDDQQRAWDTWQQAKDDKATYSIETRLRRADGVYRWWLIRGAPMKDASGSVLKWFGTCTDIHDMKLAQQDIAVASQALRESERRFSDLLRNVELVAVMLDCNANITFCNDYFLRLTGWRYEEVIGQNWFNTFIPPERGDLNPAFAALLANAPEAWHRDNELLTRDGERRLIRWNNSVLRNATGQVIGSASIGEDITEGRRAEVEIRRLNSDLERRVDERTAELLAANQELTAFDYSVSHDLKAPIRHVEGFSSMLLEDYGDTLDENGRRCVERIQEAARRMDQLVGDLLKLSLLSRGEVNRLDTDMSALVKHVCASFEQAEPGRDIACVIAPGISANADPGLLRIVLENLIGNARKFTSKRSAASIEFGCEHAAGMPVYFVRDNGAGFDAAYADKLFAPFQRLHAQGEFNGTGIGLATVRRIITRHGGKVWAVGAVNQGATIHFTLAPQKSEVN